MLQIERLTPTLGAVVSGITLDATLDDATVAEIRAALDEALVLFFRDQDLTAHAQRDVAARFGPLYRHPFYAGDPDAPEIMILDHGATRRPNSDRWHNDATYLATPPQAALLYAEVIPKLGGDTLWASMYQAYDELSEPLKQTVSRLRAVHSFAKNFHPERFDELGMRARCDEMYAANPDVSHPVVRTNPVTGRRALFVNQDFTTHIEGLPARESDAILHLLYDHMGRPEYQVRWRWRAGDVALWDNRWAQHYALGDYFPAHRRVRRATIVGDVPV